VAKVGKELKIIRGEAAMRLGFSEFDKISKDELR
jgi:hypothetical protein